MHNKLNLLSIFILCSFLLCSCGSTAKRIYTVCKVENGSTFCYNSDGDYYEITEDGKYLPSKGVGLNNKPALDLISSAGDYHFESVLPGLYSGTLESVYHYVDKIVTTDNATVDIPYRDWNNLEIFLYTDKYSVRVIYNIRGEVRLYAVDKSNKFIQPPYINEKK